MDEKDLSRIRIAAQTAAIETLLVAVSSELAAVTAKPVLLRWRRRLENSQGTIDATAFPQLDAAQSDLAAGEFQEAWRSLVANLMRDWPALS